MAIMFLSIFQIIILIYSSVLVLCSSTNHTISNNNIPNKSSTQQQQSSKSSLTTLLDDHSWKRDVYTNRTLRLDQDPLHVAYANRRKSMDTQNYYIKKYDTILQQPNCSIDNKENVCLSLTSSKKSTNHYYYDVIPPNHYYCCQDVYDCELCQLLKGYKTVEAIEVLNEIIKILENQDELFINNQNCDQQNNENQQIDTTCILTAYYNSWKL